MQHQGVTKGYMGSWVPFFLSLVLPTRSLPHVQVQEDWRRIMIAKQNIIEVRRGNAQRSVNHALACAVVL